MKLRPEPNPEDDAIIATAFEGLRNGTKTNEEASNEIAHIFAYMFVNRSEEGVPATPPATKMALLRRLFGW